MKTTSTSEVLIILNPRKSPDKLGWILSLSPSPEETLQLSLPLQEPVQKLFSMNFVLKSPAQALAELRNSSPASDDDNTSTVSNTVSNH